MGMTSYHMMAVGPDGSRVQFVSELGRKCPIPVVVTMRKIQDGEPDDDLNAEPTRILKLTFDLDGAGAFRLAGLMVLADEQQPGIDSADIRNVKVGELHSYALRYLSKSMDRWPEDGYGPMTMFEPAAVDWAAAWRSRGVSAGEAENMPPLTVVDDEFRVDPGWLAQARRLGPSSPIVSKSVAALYRLAERLGEAPNAVIQEKFGLSRSTASHWIKLARQAGDLGPAKRKPRTVKADHGNN